MSLIGVDVLAITDGGDTRLLCALRLGADGRAVVARGTNTWVCDDLMNNGVVTGGAATPFAFLLGSGFAVPIQLHHRYFLSDGAPFLVAVMAEFREGRTVAVPVTDDEQDALP